jgi:glycosyltransferase involved in cell wall biosynthesis
VRHCEYIPTPVPDPGHPPEAVFRPDPNVLRILHLGHLGGAASMSGLPLLLDETIPQLVEALGQDGFELHFVGRVDLKEPLRSRLQHPSIRLRGFVESLDEEMRMADVFVVPIPHEVGSRTRLLTAMAYGSCIVAHRSAALGNPELRHEDNILLASTGTGLAREILRAWGDDELRSQLKASARSTYVNYFSPVTAGEKWLSAILTAVVKHRRRGAGVRMTGIHPTQST